jgi:dTDP-N-acetylfucosamine:lipid II N-acetylfucosaminyltransferase
MTKRIKNLHIVYPEKFFDEYVKFVNKNFDPKNHLFLYLKTNGKEPVSENVSKLKFYRWGIFFYWELYTYFKSSERIILHSLLKNKVIYFLFLFPKFKRKCCWYLWGGDLYNKLDDFSKPWHNWFYEYVFKKVASGIGMVVTHIAGDVDIARSQLGFSGTHINCFLYPSNYFHELTPLGEHSDKSNKKLVVMVGNSAHISNDHIPALEKLEAVKHQISIICPLSYGNKKYGAKVKAKGQAIFKDDFQPLEGFLPLLEYLQILSKVDVAIFNNWRQQGVGNIINLVGLGKTVYLRSDTTTWNMLKQIGVVVFDFCEFNRLQLLSHEERQSNIRIIKETFNEETLKAQSAEVFA